MRFFSFYVADVTVFQTLCFLSHYLSWTPLNPKSIFTKIPSFSSKNLCKITSRYVFLNIVFIFVLDYADFSLRFWNLGIFEKGIGVPIFCENFFKILIGLSPICYVCICVGPMRHSNHVLRQISSCSCIFHRCCALLHVRCLTEFPSDILMLNWTQVSPFAGVYSCLPMFNIFWSMIFEGELAQLGGA